MSYTGTIGRVGAVLDCLVRVPSMWPSNLPGGIREKRTKAMLDTGATITMVDADLADMIQLPRGGAPMRLQGVQPAKVYAASSSIVLDTVALELALEKGQTFHMLKASKTPLPANLVQEGVQLIIGRNLLDVCRLEWDGVAGTFALSVLGSPK